MRSTLTLLMAFCLLFLMPADASAERGKLKADCIIQLKGTKGGQTRVTVMPGTSPAYVLKPTNLHFMLELALDETYLLTFEHPECVTKQLYVDASVTLEQRSNDFDFPLKVVLQHHKEPFTYAGPVGFIYYEHGLADFSYHTDYAIDINERFAERMAEFERTGVDPRSATLGYSATTAPPEMAPVAPKKEDPPLTPWSTVAPTVSHVAPQVHRLTRDDSPRTEEPVAPVKAQELRAPVPPRMTPRVPEASPPTDVEVRNADVPEVLDDLPTADLGSASHEAELSEPAFTWELIVEERRVTTIMRSTDAYDRSTEYRRVLHSTGNAYYFQDGRSISEYSYMQGTQHARMQAAAPDRGNLDLIP